MSSDTDLHLIFKNAAGKKVILKIENPHFYRRRSGGSGRRLPAYHHYGQDLRVMKRGPRHGDNGIIQLH